MNIVLFGAPGAGKGTQSSILVEKLGMHQISTGDLFRAAIKNKTSLGVQAQQYMDKGELVPDSVVISMVDEVLVSLGSKSFILDGFPRTVAQAEALQNILKSRKLTIGKAIFLEVPRTELMDRLTGRRVCKSCGAVYHVKTKPTKVDGICDSCGGEVYQRNDDKDDVILNRLKTYDESTFPLKAFYKEMGSYIEIKADQATDRVFDLIKNAMAQ